MTYKIRKDFKTYEEYSAYLQGAIDGMDEIEKIYKEARK